MDLLKYPCDLTPSTQLRQSARHPTISWRYHSKGPQESLNRSLELMRMVHVGQVCSVFDFHFLNYWNMLLHIIGSRKNVRCVVLADNYQDWNVEVLQTIKCRCL